MQKRLVDILPGCRCNRERRDGVLAIQEPHYASLSIQRPRLTSGLQDIRSAATSLLYGVGQIAATPDPVTQLDHW